MGENVMRRRSVIVAAIMSVSALGSAASAKVFSLVDDFGSAPFSYGTVSAPGAFTAFASSDCTNINVSGLCFRGSDTYQVAFQHDAGHLLIHPGPNDMQNTFVAFTAPHSGVYTFNVTITRGDTGDGVNVYSLGQHTLTPVGRVDATTPTFVYAGSQFFAAGDLVGLGVDRGGVTRATITAIRPSLVARSRVPFPSRLRGR